VEEFLRRLGQRKIIQWALAYAAGAFAAIQVLDIVAQRFAWPESSIRLVIVAFAIGFAVTLVLAWYHGERGVQRVSGAELLVLALLLAIGGGWLWRVAQAPAPSNTASAGDSSSPPAKVAAAAGKPVAAAAEVINEKSIAVLPLVNTSGDPANEYFSDGLSDELISVLASVPDLKIIGRSSSFHFKNSIEDSRTIGAKLGVARLLEGSVRKQDNRVRISVELVNASDARQMWSETYERELKDIFAVQSEIATSVVAKLKLKLAAAGAQPQTSTRNLEAYNALLRGDFHRSRFTFADYRKAVEYYDEAIRLAPDYAVAYARLSRIWRALAAIWISDPAEIADGYAHARRAAEEAVRLAPDLGEGYMGLGWVQETRDFAFEEAEANMRRALALAPGDAEIKSALAYTVASRGHLVEGLALWHEAMDVNPYVGAGQLMGTRMLMGLGRYEEAAAAAYKAIEVDPGISHAHTYLTMIALARGDVATAQREAELEEKGFWIDFARALAIQRGDRKEADAALQRFTEQYDNIAAFQVASLHALRGDPDAMYAALDRALAFKDSGLTQLLSDPFIVKYHEEPRFVAFCARLNIDCSLKATAPLTASADH